MEQRKRQKRIPVVGITGGIGSGKTVVAKVFARMGSYLIDADLAGKEILENDTDVQKNVIQEFGKEILDEEGKIDRKCLGSMVFTSQEKLRTLNKIIQAKLIQAVKDEISEGLRRRKHEMVAVDAAIIFEAGVESFFDYIITVTARMQDRVKWLKARGLSEREAQARIASQMKQEEKASRSHFILENTASIADLERNAEELYAKIAGMC